MADNKKYYYLKLKDNFFDSEEMIILQNMPDGYLYSDILLKLYLRSLKNNGKLMFNDYIPYNAEVLAQIVRHQVGTIEKALNIFQKLGLIEVLDNGAIYMLEIQNFIGESTTEADRKRLYRAKIKAEQQQLQLNDGQMSSQSSDKNPPEIEKEIKIKKDKEIESEKNFDTQYLLLKTYMARYFDLSNSKTFADFNKIASFLKIMESDVILKAINNAISRNIPNTTYILNTLNNWKSESKLTVQAVEGGKNEQ